MKKTHKIILLVICIIFFITISVFSFITYRKYITPTIFLNGDQKVTLNLSEDYIELGANSFINNNKKNISNKIVITNNIDNTKPGMYKVYYTVNSSNIKKTITRNVEVIDNIAPVISLNGKEELTIGLNSKYEDKGATATDNIDGDLTNLIQITGGVDTSKPGTYKIIYSIEDAAGNKSEIERKINVVEYKPTYTPSTAYIKISIDEQKIWLYNNDALILESNIVTGTVGSHDTPRGKFTIYSKARNTYLKGADYVSYVNYWMAIYGGVGLHDATWRSEFGGSIYTTNGSHGCINLPQNVAATIYEIAPVGTVVEVY